MKKLLLGLICITSVVGASAQSYPCDIAQTGLSVTPGVIAIGQTADFTFSIYNAGSSTGCTIPANTVDVALSLPSDINGIPQYYVFQSVISPAGGAGAFFTWSYDLFNNAVVGINHNPIPNGVGELNVTIRVVAIGLTGPGGAISGLNIQQCCGTTNNPINDVSSAPLIVSVITPVRLSDFDISTKDCRNSLKWISVTEESAKEFQVEVSTDGSVFTQVATVPASGNSNTRKNYSWIDAAPKNGINYYRLKMIDIDGNYLYSKIVSVSAKCKVRTVDFHPNPVTEGKNLTVILGGYEGSIKAELMTATGQLLATFNLKNGSNTLPVDNMAQGTYMVRVTQVSTGDAESFRVVIIK